MALPVNRPSKATSGTDQYVSGTTIEPGEVNSDFNTIYSGVNNLEHDDIVDESRWKGKQTLQINVEGMLDPVTNAAAPLATMESAANAEIRPLRSMRVFSNSTQQHLQFRFRFPQSWNAGTITYNVGWQHEGGQTAGLDGVAWGLRAIALSSGDSYDQDMGTEIVVTDDQSTSNTHYETSESSALTIGGTPAKGDTVFFRISRVVANGADDFDGNNLGLTYVTLFWTNDALIDT